MICWDTTKSEDKVIGGICGTLFVSGDDRLICWDTTKSEDKIIGVICGTLFVSGNDRLICWDTTKSEDKVIGVICGTLFVSGDDRLICWDTTKSEDKLIGVSEIDLEENWDTTKSVGVSEVNLEENWVFFVILLEDAIETSCCRLSTILPVGTAIKFPILIYLFGGLSRADIRDLVKWASQTSPTGTSKTGRRT